MAVGVGPKKTIGNIIKKIKEEKKKKMGTPSLHQVKVVVLMLLEKVKVLLVKNQKLNAEEWQKVVDQDSMQTSTPKEKAEEG